MPGIDYSIHSVNPAVQGPAPAVKAAEPEGFSFDDFLDIINPLQHLPVISTIYRHLTGDKIGLPEKIAGDGLYGGVVGLACSIGDALFQQITGKDVGDTVYAFLTGEDDATTSVASASASVLPASSMHIALPEMALPQLSMPDLSGVFDADDDEASGPPALLSPLAARRAAGAYGKAAMLAPAY